MNLLRMFAALLIAFTFTFVGCSKDTGNTPGDTTGVEKDTPDNTDAAIDDGSGAPAEQPDDAEADDDAPADDAPADDAPADDAPAEEAPSEDASGDDAPADAEEKGADAPAKKDGE
jgi:hypothetical protein